MKVQGKDVKVLTIFPVMHSGWECDDQGFVVNDEGKLKVVLTNNGSAYFADIDELQGKITEYRNAIAHTEGAIRAVERNDLWT